MIADIHLAIRHMILSRGLIPADEVEVRFERPTKEWVNSLVRPTINLYLFDIDENVELRQTNMPVMRSGGAAYRMPARRFDLRYMVTAFATVAADEHLLIYRVLATLLRFPTLPPSSLAAAMAIIAGREGYAAEEARFAALAAAGERTTLGDLRSALASIEVGSATRSAMMALVDEPQVTTKIASAEESQRLLDVWNALEQAPRASLLYVVTVPVDLDIVIDTPLVLTRMLRVQQRADAGTSTEFIRIGGAVRDHTGAPLAGVTVAIEGGAIETVTDSEGRYALSHVPAGKATLRVRRPDGRIHMTTFATPSDSYDIVLD
ncbi:MAG: Pvc16 family protein [Roseiflexus sp.]|nr:Pvc16 family protein [Roseiflexus sp.]